jgi:hypothetical protein
MFSNYFRNKSFKITLESPELRAVTFKEVVDEVALGQVFSEYVGFPCQSTFHLLLHNQLHYHSRLAQ